MSFLNDFNMKEPLSDKNPLAIFGFTTITVYLKKIEKLFIWYTQNHSGSLVHRSKKLNR